jgi:SP family sugar:H+ symporter-like MFS transporter
MLLFPDFINRFGQVQGDGSIAFDSTISSLLVSLMSIGTLIGALAGAYTADWFGRRRSLSIGVAVFVLGNIIQITAQNTWVHITIGRIVAGLGVGVLSIGVPMYQSEVCPKEIRGAVVASYQLMITIGILSKSDTESYMNYTYISRSLEHHQLRRSRQSGRRHRRVMEDRHWS